MTNDQDVIPGDKIPEAVVQKHSRISTIWLIPLVAALVGIWIAYKAISEQGPLITIQFKTAEGLVAGKTKVKFKDVDIGQVESIFLDHEDLSKVIIKVRMQAHSEKFLTDKTRFWVVRARIRAGGVTGLSTLLSGAYIGVDPVREGKLTKKFTGLEIAPAVTTDQPGQHFILEAKSRSSLEVGSPVYFRQVKVGEVVSYALADNGESVNVTVFVNAPHHNRITGNTRFWDAGGVDISLSAEGVKVDTESVVSLLIGGIAYGIPDYMEPGEPVEDGHIFRLFDSHKEAIKPEIRVRRKYLLSFDGSVRGLTVGAPVEFRGIPFGRVLKIDFHFDEKTKTIKIPVLIEAEPERLGDDYSKTLSSEESLSNLGKLVEKGLRAQLKTGSLLTGQLYVAIDFHSDAPTAELDLSGKYPELPTVPAQFDEITRSVAEVLDKLERFPLDEIGGNLITSLEDLDKTIKQADATLQSIDQMFSADAPLAQELQNTLTELSETARSLRLLADYLDRHPEALIRGK